MGKLHISEEQINKITNLYVNESYTCDKIGKIMHYNRRTISKILKENNINLRDNLIDLKDKTFGNWFVKERDNNKTSSKNTYWICECQCANKTTRTITSGKLRSGHTKSCGCNRNRKYEPWETSARSVYKGSYADDNILFNDFLKLSQMNCHYCGKIPSNKYNGFRKDTISFQSGNFTYSGLDRIDSNKSHNINNVVPCCRQCNIAKSYYSEEEFRNWIIKIYNNYVCQ